MRLIDYNTEQYRDYARGRALSAGQLRVWLDAFAAVLPEKRPLAGVDVGSGTGRFTPALADAFGPVTGVEPAERMRAVAEAGARHPHVRYRAGSAEDLPLPDDSADYALMFLSWHHVTDKPTAARELARVVRPGGRLLLRANFRDHHPRPWWLAHFPGGYEVDAAIFEPLHEVIATFTGAGVGWRVAHFGTVTEPSVGTRAEMLERLRLRTFSFFGRLSAEEADAGLRSIERLVAEDPDAPSAEFTETLLTFELSSQE
ncbi:class I SAM-dependent methyltransferase [Actinoplanes sp. CA-030573]|uniref:class I SAM-dependent methyltransferase n=1 Tax=Actinoplanes sp. CA-030573 TaxID=3239898 RepID=UPI003D9360DA